VISSNLGSGSGGWPGDQVAAISRVQFLEHETFDEGGHLRQGVDQATAELTVAQINELRHWLGWLEIDLCGRWLWPASELTPAAA
jgi:hypothetical protein